MKFFFHLNTETQSDWFANRGISWHISVVARKMNGVFESQTFVHIAENTPEKELCTARVCGLHK